MTYFSPSRLTMQPQGLETDEGFSLSPLLAAPLWISGHFTLLGSKEGIQWQGNKEKCMLVHLQLPLPPKSHTTTHE